MEQLLRLKIHIETNDFEFVKNLNINFWYFLDLEQLKTIEAFEQDLIYKIFKYHQISINAKNVNNKKNDRFLNFKFTSVKLTLDNFELPHFESTSLLRESDNVV